MAIENRKIEHEHIIICEGRDEQNFLLSFLKSSEMQRKDQRLGENVGVLNFGGNDELPIFLKNIRNTPGYNKVKTILIMRDAETSVTQAIDQIGSALERSGFALPERTGYWSDAKEVKVAFLLFPDLNDNPTEGTLEDLCLRLLKEEYQPEIVIDKISDIMSCLKNKGVRYFKHDFKTRLHSFFSLTDGFVGSKVGEAARYGAFNWESIELEYLYKMIIEAFG